MLRVEWLCWWCEKPNKAKINPPLNYLKEGDALTTNEVECLHCGAESKIDIMVHSYRGGSDNNA